jgi:uncharacterized protein
MIEGALDQPAIKLRLLPIPTAEPNATGDDMTDGPVEVVQQVLANLTKADVLNDLIADDATYISLNYEDKDLKKILPWAGTSKGPSAFIDTFPKGVLKYWVVESFDVKEIFGTGENVAVFGSFTLKSNTLGKVVTSPFGILAKVRDGKVVYWQFLEDSYGTASTFKAGGSWKVRNDPDAPNEIEV